MEPEKGIDWLGFCFGLYLLLSFYIPALAEPLVWIKESVFDAALWAVIALPAFLFLVFVYLLTKNEAVRDWGVKARDLVMDTIVSAVAGLLYFLFGILISIRLGVWTMGTSLDLPIMLGAVFIGFLQIFTSLRQLGYWRL